MASGDEQSDSDVDVMIIGTVPSSDLALSLRRARDLLGREVNPTTYTAGEFNKKRAAKDHVLTNVLSSSVAYKRRSCTAFFPMPDCGSFVRGAILRTVFGRRTHTISAASISRAIWCRIVNRHPLGLMPEQILTVLDRKDPFQPLRPRR